jgi:lipoprotein-anchoring transpeptidase ErfK/SrfK
MSRVAVSRLAVRWLVAFGLAMSALLLQFAPATASVVAKVDIASQSMTVVVDGAVAAVWKVSTARRGYITPRGTYRPQSLARMHYSRKYDNSPMPNSVFFRGGYAIHGTYHVKSLGRPASHGCVRLAPQNAALFFDIIRLHGTRDAQIIIS